MLSFVSRVTSHSAYNNGIPMLHYTESIMKAFTNEAKVSK